MSKTNMNSNDYICSNCYNGDEDVLILSCEHNLCLTCSGYNLKQNNTHNVINNN